MLQTATLRAIRSLMAVGTLAVAGSLGACATSTSGTTESTVVPKNSALLTVTNRSNYDMDVYLVRSGQRIRLGLAPGSQSTRYELKPAQFIGFGQIQFLALPIVSGSAVSTELLDVKAGDRIDLDIPPQ
jgi:hypothetical protein